MHVSLCLCMCVCLCVRVFVHVRACVLLTMINYGMAGGQWHHLTGRLAAALFTAAETSIRSLWLRESIEEVCPPDVNVNLTINTRTHTKTMVTYVTTVL